MATKNDSYAIIAVGGKQYLVRQGERVLVERVGMTEGTTFHPDILFFNGGGDGQLGPKGATVTAKVVGHVLGDKVLIGKYRPKSGYRRHWGFRAQLSQIEIESIAAGTRRAAPKEGPAAPAKEAPAAEGHEQELPKGYADFTVAEINENAKRWTPAQLEAALVYERAHAKRKGAVAALESAIETQKEND